MVAEKMADVKMMEISGWGRYPSALASTISPRTLDDALLFGQGQLIARGQGRSYGDAAILSDGLVVLTDSLKGVSSFDESTGLLAAEPGLTLAEILHVAVPRGWFPSVVPGTKFVSLGGCIAADIHGKNHHREGTFGNGVSGLQLMLADGSRAVCSPVENADLFWATIGGMGLTGIISAVTLQMAAIPSPYIVVQHHQARDLDESMGILNSAGYDDDYTVVWLDCLAQRQSLGRGILIRGHHAAQHELTENVKPGSTSPERIRNLNFDFPQWVLNPLTIGAFNEIYYRWQGRKRKPLICHYDSFFFPLDRIGNWNRMYGKRGFVQYQCVLPLAQSRAGLRMLLEEAARSSRASFLGVLKRFGPEGKGLLSFPLEGYTLTLDFPVTGKELFPFLDRLDEIVLQHGGRVYLAKDARLSADSFRQMYPRLEEWRRIKSQVDPTNRFSSDLARRLELSSAWAIGDGNSYSASGEGFRKSR